MNSVAIRFAYVIGSFASDSFIPGRLGEGGSDRDFLVRLGLDEG